MSDNETPPIIAPTPGMDQATSAVRTLVLAVTVVTALAGFVSKHDLAGFIVYVQSNDFLAFLAAVIGAGSIAWGQWKVRHRANQLQAIKNDPRVPDSVVK